MLSNYKTLLELSIDSYLKLVKKLEWPKLQKILKTVLNKLEGQGNQDIQKIAIKLLSAILGELPLKDNIDHYIRNNSGQKNIFENQQLIIEDQEILESSY